MLNEQGRVISAYSLGKSVVVQFTGRRTVSFSLRGNVATSDLSQICRAINEGVRAQEACSFPNIRVCAAPKCDAEVPVYATYCGDHEEA